MIDIVICDDVKEDLEKTAAFIREIFEEEELDYTLWSFCSAIEMLDGVKQVNIAILDIAMDDINGIDLGRKLKQRFAEIKIIYTTSYEQYCMQAINEIHAYSFLCKPLEKDELQTQIMDLAGDILYSNDVKEKKFYRVSDHDGNKMQSIKLKLKDIIYFEFIKTDRKIAIILVDRVYKFSYVMEKLSEELKGEGFAVNCRGQLVNLRHVSKLKGYNIHLDNGQILSLSQKRVSEFKKSMNDFLHQ